MVASWDQVAIELEAARRWEEEGNHGRARVCARRAAGWAVGICYSQPVESSQEGNAYHWLLLFQDLETTPGELRSAAQRLTTRVTEDHTLPFEEDPISDAEMIVQALRNASETSDAAG
jgi:hypothetical protein